MRRARQGDLNAFVPNNLFFALPVANRSGLLGRHNQCLMNELRCLPLFNTLPTTAVGGMIQLLSQDQSWENASTASVPD